MPQIATLGTLRFRLGSAPWPIDFFAPDDLPGFLDRIYVVAGVGLAHSGRACRGERAPAPIVVSEHGTLAAARMVQTVSLP